MSMGNRTALNTKLIALLFIGASLSSHQVRAESPVVESPSAGVPEISSTSISPTPLVIETGDGDIQFHIEIADDQAERSKGLMHRQTMADDAGMLFCFESTRPVTMWMKNTPMSLDMLFVREDFSIARIAEGTEPFSEAIVPSGEPIRFVLEVKAGRAKANGITSGNRLIHPAMKDCLKEE